jgi:hypothetical protein
MMNRDQFEAFTRRLTTETSRRQIVVGALGGAAALLAGTTVAGPGKKGGGSGAKGKPTKVAICHYDKETELYTFLQVPTTALKGHQKHTNDVLTGVTSAADCEALNAAILDPIPDPGLG